MPIEQTPLQRLPADEVTVISNGVVRFTGAVQKTAATPAATDAPQQKTAPATSGGSEKKSIRALLQQNRKAKRASGTKRRPTVTASESSGGKSGGSDSTQVALSRPKEKAQSAAKQNKVGRGACGVNKPAKKNEKGSSGNKSYVACPRPCRSARTVPKKRH